MYACLGSDIKQHQHRVLALMTIDIDWPLSKKQTHYYVDVQVFSLIVSVFGCANVVCALSCMTLCLEYL
jgi:hypothetical protein